MDKIHRKFIKLKRFCFHQNGLLKPFMVGYSVFLALIVSFKGLFSSGFKGLISFLLSFGAKGDPISPFLDD
ncbi:hypothetical protein HMPREF1402_00031 [Helicobacter pylori GAM121Aii]|nr:hypothetical protein HMPREF1402_00031 [Helicobacter pylori GAM121Aii]